MKLLLIISILFAGFLIACNQKKKQNTSFEEIYNRVTDSVVLVCGDSSAMGIQFRWMMKGRSDVSLREQFYLHQDIIYLNYDAIQDKYDYPMDSLKNFIKYKRLMMAVHTSIDSQFKNQNLDIRSNMLEQEEKNIKLLESIRGTK